MLAHRGAQSCVFGGTVMCHHSAIALTCDALVVSTSGSVDNLTHMSIELLLLVTQNTLLILDNVLLQMKVLKNCGIIKLMSCTGCFQKRTPVL